MRHTGVIYEKNCNSRDGSGSRLGFDGSGSGAIMLMPGFIEENVPQFNSIVKSCGSELVIMEEDSYGISKGAALMCIQK